MKMLWLSFLLIGSITCGPVRKDYGSNSADSTFRQQPYSSGYRNSGTGTSSGPGSSSPLPSLTNPSSDKATELPAQDVVYYGPGSDGSTNKAEGEASSSGYSSYNSPEVGQYGAAYAASRYDVAAPAGGYGGGYGSYNTPEFDVAYAAPAGGYGGGYSSYNTPEFDIAYAAPAGGYGGGYGSYNSPEVGVAYAAPVGGYGGGYGSSAGLYGGESSYGFAPRDEASSSGSAGEEVPEPVFSDVSDLEPVYSFSSRSNYQRGRAVFAQTRYIPEAPAPPPLPVSISKTASKQSNPSKAAKYGY